MNKHRLWIIVTALVVSGMLLISCQPQTIVETVEVEVPVEVEVEKEVEVPVEVEVEVAAEVFNLEVWAEANEVEHYRVTAPMMAGPLVNEML